MRARVRQPRVGDQQSGRLAEPPPVLLARSVPRAALREGRHGRARARARRPVPGAADGGRGAQGRPPGCGRDGRARLPRRAAARAGRRRGRALVHHRRGAAQRGAHGRVLPRRAAQLARRRVRAAGAGCARFAMTSPSISNKAACSASVCQLGTHAMFGRARPSALARAALQPGFAKGLACLPSAGRTGHYIVFMRPLSTAAYLTSGAQVRRLATATRSSLATARSSTAAPPSSAPTARCGLRTSCTAR